MRFPKRLKEQRGQFFFLLLVTVVLILGVVGLGVDGGKLYFRWTGLSRALDAACVAVIKKAPALTDSQIISMTRQVATFNLQQQGADISKFIFEGQVTRRPEYTKLIKIKITGTLQDIPSVLIKLIPGNNGSANVKDNTRCPTCYNNPDVFNIPASGGYQGGMSCQKICNDGTFKIPGTNTCCDYAHSWRSDEPGNKCMCSYNAAFPSLTGNCDPNAQGPQASIDPNNPGVTGPIWIDRTLMDPLATACGNYCGLQGKWGATYCNEDCREETGTICCMCHCVDPGPCEPCDSSDDIIRCPLECGPHCNNGTCEVGLGETCGNCPQDCGTCSPTCGDHICAPVTENCLNCTIDCGMCAACPANENCAAPGPCPAGSTATSNQCIQPGPGGTITNGVCCKPQEPNCDSADDCAGNSLGAFCCNGMCQAMPCQIPCNPGTDCQSGLCPPPAVSTGLCTVNNAGSPIQNGNCCPPPTGFCSTNADCPTAMPNCCFPGGLPSPGTGTCQAAPCPAPCPLNYTCQVACPGGPAGAGGPCTTNTGVSGMCCPTNPSCTAGTTCTAAPAGMITCPGGIASTGQCSTTGTGPIDGICCPPTGPPCYTPGFTCQTTCNSGMAGSPPASNYCPTGTMCCPPSCTAGSTCTAGGAPGSSCPGGFPSTGQCSISGTTVDGICCPPPGPSCSTPGFTCQISCGSGMTGSPPAGGYCPTGTMCCPPSCTAGNTCTAGGAPGSSCPGGFPSAGQCSTSGTTVDGICCPPTGPPCSAQNYTCQTSCGTGTAGSPPTGGYCPQGTMCCPPSGNPCAAPNVCQTACGTGGAGTPPAGGYCPTGTMCCPATGSACTSNANCGAAMPYCCNNICQVSPCSGPPPGGCGGCTEGPSPLGCVSDCDVSGMGINMSTCAQNPTYGTWSCSMTPPTSGCTNPCDGCIRAPVVCSSWIDTGGGTGFCDPVTVGWTARDCSSNVGPFATACDVLRAAYGCGGTPPTTCPGTCPAGTMCVAGACAPGCNASSPCPSNQTCTNGQCMPSVPATCPGQSNCLASCPAGVTSVGSCSMGGPAMPTGSCCPYIPTCSGNSMCSATPCNTAQGYTQTSSGPCASAPSTSTPTGNYCCEPPPSTCPNNSTCMASCPIPGTSVAFCSMGGPAMPTGFCCPYIPTCTGNSMCSFSPCMTGFTQTGSGPCASGPNTSVAAGNYCCAPPPSCPTNSFCSQVPCVNYPGHPSVRSGPCSMGGPAMPAGIDCCLN